MQPKLVVITGPTASGKTALGVVHGSGRYSGNRKYRRSGGSDCHRRPGSHLLDVVFCRFRHVYQICRGDAGCPFPRAE